MCTAFSSVYPQLSFFLCLLQTFSSTFTPLCLGCAVTAVIVCQCVISCLNEREVNEINFSCPYMGIALTHSRIAGAGCMCVCVSNCPLTSQTYVLPLYMKNLHHLHRTHIFFPGFSSVITFSDGHKILFNLKSYCIFIFWIGAHS